MTRRVAQILKEKNIGLETFLEPIKSLGFSLGVNSKYTPDDEQYIANLLECGKDKELAIFYHSICKKEDEIKRLQKEILSIRKSIDSIQINFPIRNVPIEELNQFEKIILFKKLLQEIKKEYSELFEQIFFPPQIEYSIENLRTLYGWKESYNRIDNILQYRLSEQGLSNIEKRMFFYMLIEKDSSGNMRRRKMFFLDFPKQFHVYSDDNFEKLTKWYHSLSRNIRVSAVRPDYSDIDEETAIMSMLKDGYGDSIGF
jgi:hypothetical protein